MKKNLKSEPRNFKKLSNVEHVRMRTGMWLGQNSLNTFEQHFIEKNQKGLYEIIHKEIKDIPAKLKCLDEACMNAIDEYKKNQADASLSNKEKMSFLKVELSADKKRVKVTDNGRGIPFKNAEDVYLHLMYGENFDDHFKQEQVSGQNGVGISLVRIVSRYFKVTTCNQGFLFKKLFTIPEKLNEKIESFRFTKEEKKKIYLYFDENGTFDKSPFLKPIHFKSIHPILKEHDMITVEEKSKEHGTSVEFELNPEYFNNLDISFDPDIVYQYLFNLAITNPNLKIEFLHNQQNKKFHFKKGFDELFSNSDMNYYKIDYKDPQSKSKISLESYLVIGNDKNLTWVNSTFASQGGSAIEYFENRICDEVRKKSQIVNFEKKLKTNCTRNDIRNCFHVYINLKILNPRFKSQDKSYLINDLSEDIRKIIEQHLDKFIKKTNFLEEVKLQIEKRTQIKAFEDAQKSLRRANRTKIPKLITPTGKTKEKGRILFIAEGDSAVAGLRPVRNPTLHGLFPLRGKPLNCKGVPLAKAMTNEEFKNIIAILNLPLDKKIKNIGELNYEKVSVITDADFDGYAIRSLMLSFFYEYWPELYELGFIHISNAPLYEVDTKIKNKKQTFFCINDQDYNQLVKEISKQNGEITRKKRNKGLGETGKEAMKFAVNRCMFQIALKDKRKATYIQKLWFHKDFAAKRRNSISEYKMTIIED